MASPASSPTAAAAAHAPLVTSTSTKPGATGCRRQSPAEKDMVECALHVQENSRLSCQIKVVDELDGLVVRIPESQI